MLHTVGNFCRASWDAILGVKGRYYKNWVLLRNITHQEVRIASTNTQSGRKNLILFCKEC